MMYIYLYTYCIPDTSRGVDIWYMPGIIHTGISNRDCGCFPFPCYVLVPVPVPGYMAPLSAMCYVLCIYAHRSNIQWQYICICDMCIRYITARMVLHDAKCYRYVYYLSIYTYIYCVVLCLLYIYILLIIDILISSISLYYVVYKFSYVISCRGAAAALPFATLRSSPCRLARSRAAMPL